MMRVRSLGGADMMHARSVCVSENACMYFWEGPNCVQVVKHPGSLWDVDVREVVDSAGNRHFWAITACSDGAVRLFSTNPAEWLPEDLRVDFEGGKRSDGIAQLFESVRGEGESAGSVWRGSASEW